MIEIASGDLDAARTRWSTFAHRFVRGTIIDPGEWLFGQLAYDRLCDLGEPLMVGDRAGLAALLRRWEGENAASAGFGPYWEPTPLPFEGR